MEPIKRTIEIAAGDGAPGEVLIKASLMDNYHEMSMCITACAKDLRIKTITAEIIRAPYDRCRNVTDELSRVVGLCLGKGFTRRALDAIGGDKGCTHLTNLVIQINAASVIYHPRWKGVTREERLRVFQNACMIYKESNRGH